MIKLFHLLFAPVFSAVMVWVLEQDAVESPKSLDSVHTAKALAAIAAILILGLGGVLVIALSGRWIKRLLFPKDPQSLPPSEGSIMGKVDWALPKPDPNENDILNDLPNHPKKDP